MEDFEKLQNIGAKEISKNTHIALSKIQCILERNFKELRDKATTHGLLQILEREYRISLKAWEEEYKAFWDTYDGADEEVGPIVNFKVTHETITPNDSKKGVLLGALLVVLLGIGFFAYMNFYGNSVVADTKEKAEAQNTESKEVSDEKDSKENNVTNVLEVTDSLDASASIPINTLPQDSKDIQELESKNTESNALTNVQNSEATSQELAIAKKISIVPMNHVWVGIVYLDSRKRTSFIAENAFEVDLTRPQTIITGHGMLEINTGGEKSAFNSANKMFFAVDKEGNFEQVTQGQYETKTRGLGW
ncbi:hypothetical protein [Helicobacter turcicus]|uniref:Sialidase A n=1 Tax=Helicobacter turcicus TaxID=2867412 RepID=A0ABS7JMT8_9HELI|nr:hypothetical protein [Helicobacter turcicus]MBX7490708.1 hypothetical protein [Helicobacter turcicus]MBX7545683.1 hypothetical protein [Helicobacter turcicus]